MKPATIVKHLESIDRKRDLIRRTEFRIAADRLKAQIKVLESAIEEGSFIPATEISCDLMSLFRRHHLNRRQRIALIEYLESPAATEEAFLLLPTTVQYALREWGDGANVRPC